MSVDGELVNRNNVWRLQAPDPPSVAESSPSSAAADGTTNPSGSRAPQPPQPSSKHGTGARAAVQPRLRGGRSQRQRPDQLEALPAEVLWRVLSFISADDLASCAAVSRSMRSAAAGDSPAVDHLWRRLWCARCASDPHFTARLGGRGALIDQAGPVRSRRTSGA